MSNLTPEDVDLRLTAAKAELTEEDQRLWQGLEDEKISRVAGDEANKQLIDQAKQQNSGTESRLSTEVIHRSEGDISNLNSLNAVAQALSDYRIKTDLEINNEIIARKALGVELNTRIDSFVATWDHQKYLIYQAIQDVQDDLDGKYSAMDVRIKKYENMLQNITTDSIQITMDNGEINMGVWTILSQAREWDLQIIAKMKDYQLATTGDLNQALEDMQNKLPVEQDIIDKAIQGLSNSQVIKDLDQKLDGSIQSIRDLDGKVDANSVATANDMLRLSAVLAAQVDAAAAALDTKLTKESGDRIAEIAKETATRTEQINLLEDGLTQEINDRIEGDEHSIELINNLKLSNDESLANIREELRVTTGKADANAAAISAIDVRLIVAEDKAGQALVNSASAVEKAESAVTATEAMASRVESVETSLLGKVDQTAFNVLEARTTATEGKVEGIVTDMTTLQSDMDAVEGTVSGHTTAINSLQINQTEMDGKITQTINDTTLLNNELVVVKDELSQKLEANALNNIYTKTETDSAISGELTKFEASLTLGTENLLRDTARLYESTKYKGFGVMQRQLSSSQESVDVFHAAVEPATENEYILSFDARASIDGAKVVSYFYNPNTTSSVTTSQGYTSTSADGNAIFSVGTEWKRYWVKWKHIPSTSKNIIMARCYPEGRDILYEFARPKLETGSIPSEYSVSPLDTATNDANNTAAIEANTATITNVTNRVTATEGQVNAQSSQLNMLQSSMNNLPIGGGNLLSNGDFSLNTMQYWAFKPGNLSTATAKVLQAGDLDSWQARAGNSKTLALHTEYDATGEFVELQQTVSVLPNTMYQMSIYTGAHRSRIELFAYQYGPAGNMLGNTHAEMTSESINDNGPNGGNTLAGYKRIKQNFTTYPNTSEVVMVVRMNCQNDSYLFATRGMFSQISNINAAAIPWIESASTGNAAAGANSLAVSTLSTEVSYLDGQVTSVSSSLLQLESTVNNHTSLLQVQGQVLNGLEASYVVKTDVDGLIAGYGLYNTGATSAFAVNAQFFYVGKPGDGKKPFMVLAEPTTIGGVTYPVGTWIDVALIANATIGTAHIADAAITSAKIGDAQINNAHIANLNAGKIDAGYLNADRIEAKSLDAGKIDVDELSALTANIGVLRTATSGSRMEIWDNVIKCYDGNTLRVQLGNLEL